MEIYLLAQVDFPKRRGVVFFMHMPSKDLHCVLLMP